MDALRLPLIDKASINVRPINWTGLPHRFMNPMELETLIALLRSVDLRRMVEFGVNEGRTAKAIMREMPGIESYIGVDVPLTYVPSKPVQRREVPSKPGVMALDDPRFKLLIRENGSLDLTAADLGAADAVFIDGDHSRDAVEHDARLAREIVRAGGIIVFHDYHNLGTVDVADVLHEQYDAGHKIAHVAGTWLAFERR